MKKITFLISLFISAVSFGQNASDLFFSMYGEGGGSNKFLEIYNGTGADVDLSEYSVELYANTATTPTNTQTFPTGTILAHGDVYVLYNGSASATEILAGDMISSVTNYNGNDALLLLKNGTPIDVFGEVGNPPSSGWNVGATTTGTLNHTLIRKTTVCSGNTTGLGSFGTDDSNSEWIVFAQDAEFSAIGAYEGCGTLSASNPSLKSFVIYPNPSNNGKVTVVTVETSDVNIVVFDILGKKVLSKRMENNELNISGLKTGIYLVQVTQNGATVTKKLIVE